MIKLKDLLTESELGPKDRATNKLWRGVLYLVADLGRATSIDVVARKKIKILLLKAAQELEETHKGPR